MIEIAHPDIYIRNPYQDLLRSKIDVNRRKDRPAWRERLFRETLSARRFHQRLVYNIKQITKPIKSPQERRSIKEAIDYSSLSYAGLKGLNSGLVSWTDKTMKLREFLKGLADRIEPLDVELGRKIRKLAYRKRRYTWRTRRGQYRGVGWFKARKLWRARTYLPDGGTVVMYGKTELDAALQFDQWVDQYHGGNLIMKNFITPDELTANRN